MDPRISKIVETLASEAPIESFTVSDLRHDIVTQNLNILRANTVLTLGLKNKSHVLFFIDRVALYPLLAVGIYEESNIIGDFYCGIKFSRRQTFEIPDPFRVKRMIVLFFDNLSISELHNDPFDRSGHTSQDTMEAMIRSSIYIFLRLLNRNTSMDFALLLREDTDDEITLFSTKSYGWDGTAFISGDKSYCISFRIDNLVLASGSQLPSEEEISEWLYYGFGRFALVDEIRYLNGVGTYMAIEKTASLS